jgi:hypothetical protein
MEGETKADFWGWGRFAPKKGRVIKNRDVKLVQADAHQAELRIRNDWLADGEAMIHEELTAGIRRHQTVYVLDLTYRLTPTADVRLGQSAFGGFSARFRKDGRCIFSDAKGEVKRPVPHYLKPQTNWPAAEWYDYSIRLADGRTVGLAVVDHPDNPPTRWHNNRGVWFINPCVTSLGPLTLKKGEPLALRYRLVCHDGPPPVELLQELARQWRQR